MSSQRRWRPGHSHQNRNRNPHHAVHNPLSSHLNQGGGAHSSPFSNDTRQAHGSTVHGNSSLHNEDYVQDEMPPRGYRKRDLSEQSNYGRDNFGGNKRGNGKQTDKRERKFFIGFKQLEAMYERSSEEIVMELANDRRGFSNTLDSKDLSGDYIFIILKLLAKMCSSAFDSNKSTVLAMVARQNFLEQVKTFILSIPLHDATDKKRNKYFWANMDTFWYSLHEVCSTLLNLVPTTAIEILPKVLGAVCLTLDNIEKTFSLHISDEIKDYYDILQEKVVLCVQEREIKEKETKFCRSAKQELLPPNDFRELSVYPTTEEITVHGRSFVRENVVKGPYKDVNDYLDIHFRLLREDFVGPLREGISEYINQTVNQTKKKKIFTVKIYDKVFFVGTQDVKDLVGVKVQFEKDPKKTKKFSRYENAKRFMYGSLVCFTKDNFGSFIFGKIIDRDIKLLEQGQIIVHFDDDIKYDLNEPYLMVECSVYFEPYYHVLKALQKIDIEKFPMTRYIIYVNHDIMNPDYVTLETQYKIDNISVQILNEKTWPSEGHFKLNHSQYMAFKTALTSEFSIIQGPPGTGKTFLGLKIVKTLIQNSEEWYDRTPILIVCYTNHALDQFLEGLITTTKQIIRVGGQSKNEQLERFNIKTMRKLLGTTHRTDATMLMFQKRNAIKFLLSDIKQWNAELDAINKCESVINFMCFETIEPDLRNSWFTNATSQNIIDWLLGGRSKQERQREIQRVRVSELEKQVKQMDVDLPENEGSGDEFLYGIDEKEKDVDLHDAEMFDDIVVNLRHLLDLNELRAKHQKLLEEYEHCAKSEDAELYNRQFYLEHEINVLQDKVEYIEERLNEGRLLKNAKKPDHIDLHQPHKMSSDNRWLLYFYWLNKYANLLTRKAQNLSEEYRKLMKEYDEIRSIEDTRLMQQMLVVGMTTTGAARLQTILQALKCKIVVVEEAAEVLESHIITSLTSKCEHLILIGDHQQLRPSTADYFIEKRMNLGISLFERMVLNNLHVSVLGVQHRMRPEISRLIRPAIYPKLEDHQSVFDFPPIRGIDHCLYFIDHKEPEEAFGESSKQNPHEAAFLVLLARHLVLNGYEPKDITILVAYLGQWCAVDSEKKKYSHLLKEVRVAVLDNYQGEECKIILLSLVRNNNNNSIGFLKIENRVCVALSRAKHGFYIMGNMDLLCANSEVWPEVKKALVEQNSIGPHLTLRCFIHQDRTTNVKNVDDFHNVAEGGCNQLCNVPLICGHTCVIMCHLTDRDHQKYRCKQPCTKLLCEDPNHKCRKLCFLDCGPCTYKVLRILPCEHQHSIECHIDPETYKCPTPVFTELPCGHKTNKPCHVDANLFRCPFPCEFRVEPCGHACELNCHVRSDPDHIQYKCRKPCAKYRVGCTDNTNQSHICRRFCFEDCEPCDVAVKKQRTKCTHVYLVPCNINVDDIDCTKPCTRSLPCNHKCKQKCNQPCGNCNIMVPKCAPVCNHPVMTKCYEEPSRKNCKGHCPLPLACGHPCRNHCNEPCTFDCKVMVDHNFPTACGHKFKIPCYLRTKDLKPTSPTLLKYCKDPCRAILSCEHKCSGSCGECYQGRIHATCQERCGVPLVCGHECIIPCREVCQPCTQKCGYRCVHTVCNKKCGDPCTKCKEPCTRRCEHVRCKNLCGDKCSVPPCTEPCSKKLPCGHPCVGFCGDDCPRLCRVCNKEELTEIFFGTEEDEEACFVQLRECKHVLESEGMEAWLSQSNENNKEINVKTCPKCKTKLMSTQRYSDYIKDAMKDINMVKQRQYGTKEKNDAERTKLLQFLSMLEAKSSRTLALYSSKLRTGITKLRERLQATKGNKRQELHSLVASTLTSKMQLIEDIVDIFNNSQIANRESRMKIIERIDIVLNYITKDENRITNQEINDIQLEINRILRITQLFQIEQSPTFKPVIAADKKVGQMYEQIKHILFSLKKYLQNLDQEVKLLLQELNKKVETAAKITDAERRQIVKAMGFTKGHWFKCPNGHIYAVGDCGGPMEKSKCNECGATIGGQSHQLVANNSLAGEMDGAAFPAWSEAANLANYDLQQFRF